MPALIETELAHTRVKPGEDWYEDYEKPAIAGCECQCGSLFFCAKVGDDSSALDSHGDLQRYCSNCYL
jgi:hypothetical protein